MLLLTTRILDVAKFTILTQTKSTVLIINPTNGHDPAISAEVNVL